MAEPKKQVPLRLNAKLRNECVRRRKKNGKYVADQLDVPPELDLH